jgi:hypothetical protein
VKPRYRGLARIAVGTLISGPDGEGTWARVDKEEGFEVVVADGATTADVLRIPGVSGEHVIGTVPLTAVTPTRRR